MRDARVRVAAEFAGTAFLLAVVVGSGIMGQRLSGGNVAIALLANSIATGAGLYALITALACFGPHFNPAVTALWLWQRKLPARLALACVLAQCTGAIIGVLATHAMFAEAPIQASMADRSGWPMLLAEVIATSGLLSVVLLAPAAAVASTVAAFITAAYWFTASTSFANPAVTLARALTASFAGIAWHDVPGFIAAQGLAVVLVGGLWSIFRRRAV